jgi:signal peptidase II
MALETERQKPSGAYLGIVPARAIRPATFYLIALLVFGSDQWSKAWVLRTLSWEQTVPIIGNIFSLTLTHNTGGAWGFLPSGNLLFVAFASIAVIALLFAYHRLSHVPLLVGAALALALGGALGNLLDRLRYSYVVDFFYFHVGSFHWPIFNIADSAITFGIALLLFHFFRAARAEAGELENPASNPLSTQEGEG